MAKLDFDWRLRGGIASAANFWLLIAVLFSFPLVLRWTGAFDVAQFGPKDPRHTRAFAKACSVLVVFLWACFSIAVIGIRRRGKISWSELIAARWNRFSTVARDLGIACLTLLGMAVIGNLSNVFLVRVQPDNPVLRAMFTPENGFEASAFLAAALSAGFVEEFVFRGYLQRQCQALCGNRMVASALQVLLFTQGHFYQGWVRLVPVLLIGILLTVVALLRKSLLPGMIAHGTGDSLVTLSFLAKHV